LFQKQTLSDALCTLGYHGISGEKAEDQQVGVEKQPSDVHDFAAVEDQRDGVEKQPLPSEVHGFAWHVEQSSCLCGEEHKSEFVGKLFLLDPAYVTGVRDAVAQLNQGSVICPEGLCMVKSWRDHMYYVLYRNDRRSDAMQILGTQGCTPGLLPAEKADPVASESTLLGEAVSLESSTRLEAKGIQGDRRPIDEHALLKQSKASANASVDVQAVGGAARAVWDAKAAQVLAPANPRSGSRRPGKSPSRPPARRGLLERLGEARLVQGRLVL
jgi:hypothetical protein